MATGAIAAMVPMEVPMAVEIRQQTMNTPGISREGGMKFRAMLTTDSLPPMEAAAPWKPPAIRYSRMTIMTPELPMFSQNTSTFFSILMPGISMQPTARPNSRATWRGKKPKGLSAPIRVKVMPQPTYRARNTIRGRNAEAPSFFWFSIVFSSFFFCFGWNVSVTGGCGPPIQLK